MKFKPCEKHLHFDIYCGDYSDIINKKAYCSKCFQKKEDEVIKSLIPKIKNRKVFKSKSFNINIKQVKN